MQIWHLTTIQNHDIPIEDGPEDGTAPIDCPTATRAGSAIFTFNDPNQFQFAEFISGNLGDKSYPVPVETSGELHIRPIEDHFESSIRVEADFHVRMFHYLNEHGTSSTF